MSIRLGGRKLMSMFLAFLLLAGSAGSVFAQATPEANGEAGPAVGDTVVMFDSNGDEAAHVAVTTLNDPDDEVEDGQRGFHWVSIEVVFENVGDDPYMPNVYGIQLVDGEGFAYTLGYASRPSEDYEARPDFSSNELAPGDTASGWLFFEVINGAVPAWIVLNDSSAQQFAVLANIDGATIEDGAATPLFDANAEEMGTITVDEIIAGFEEVDSSVEPERGMTTVGVVVTIENTGEDDIQPNNYAFYLVDDFGFLYYPAYYFRDEAGIAAYPDLPVEPIAPGDSATGIVLFDIVSDAAVNYVLYTPDYTQLYILAQPGEGSVVSGDTLEPVEVPTSDDSTDDTDDNANAGEETGDCIGVTDWATATGDNVGVLNDLDAVDADSLEDVDPDDLRDAADMINDAADAQEEIEVPAAAEDMNDALIEFLTTYADIYEDVADRLDAGEDPADIEAEMAEDETLNTMFTLLFDESTALAEACPASDVDAVFG